MASTLSCWSSVLSDSKNERLVLPPGRGFVPTQDYESMAGLQRVLVLERKPGRKLHSHLDVVRAVGHPLDRRQCCVQGLDVF